MQTQCNVLSYRIDTWFHDYNLAIEINKNGHIDRNIEYKIKWQKQKNKDLVAHLLELMMRKKTLIFLNCQRNI